MAIGPVSAAHRGRPDAQSVDYDYRRFSELTGPLQPAPTKTQEPYRVQFKRLLSKEPFAFRIWTRLISYGALLCATGLLSYMFLPSHWVKRPTVTYLNALDFVMLGALAVIELCRITGTFSAVWSTLKARDPIPVVPHPHLRIALVTTRVPSEPIEMVRRTLEAACRVQYSGTLHIWLFDETGSQELRALCRKLGVNYFTRSGIAKWNVQLTKHVLLKRLGKLLQLHRIIRAKTGFWDIQTDGTYGAKTKHGNINAARAYFTESKICYDLLVGIDTDQVPLPNIVERLAGYFWDPDVAFVVGPQVYGNYSHGYVPRFAESQASFFQAVIQRAGNRHGSPMFVGTNYAVRMSVLDQIGGFVPCITEDMATGLRIHSARNPQTGRKWRSVYTPDVLAVGEGPQSWTDYNNQQWRWAAGSFDTWKRLVWRVFFRLRPGSLLHYLLILMYYPTTAINWLLSALSGTLYLIFGASAVHVPISHWITLYGCSGVLQVSLYFWNRRHNVSPHEPEGSYGVSGMLMSAFTAPIYLSALVGVLLGRRVTFVVTAKGTNVNPDRILTFRKHLPWSILLAGVLAYGGYVGHTHPAMITWAAIGLCLSLMPLILSRFRGQKRIPPVPKQPRKALP